MTAGQRICITIFFGSVPCLALLDVVQCFYCTTCLNVYLLLSYEMIHKEIFSGQQLTFAFGAEFGGTVLFTTLRKWLFWYIRVSLLMGSYFSMIEQHSLVKFYIEPLQIPEESKYKLVFLSVCINKHWYLYRSNCIDVSLIWIFGFKYTHTSHIPVNIPTVYQLVLIFITFIFFISVLYSSYRLNLICHLLYLFYYILTLILNEIMSLCCKIQMSNCKWLNARPRKSSERAVH